MEDNKKLPQIMVVNLSEGIEPHNRTESYYRGKPWVSYGIKNDYHQYIIDRYNYSPTNGALVNGITNSIYGKGLTATDAAQKPVEYASMVSLFRKEDLRKLVGDYYLFGNAAFQIIWSNDHSKVVKVKHIPVESLRAEASEEAEPLAYYYAKDWNNIYGKRKPKRIPAFGTSEEGLEIAYLNPYRPGSHYYNPPSYSPSLKYAEVEENISVYHLSNIEGGFSPTTLINFNNGQADTPEGQREVESKVLNKFSGASGQKVLCSFNDSKDSETTMENLQISDASEQYQFLAEESMKKLMVGHKVSSPLLFGINSNTGFSSNAEELKNASIFMDETVIEPFREVLYDFLDDILIENQVTLNLKFISNQPWVAIEEESNQEKQI